MLRGMNTRIFALALVLTLVAGCSSKQNKSESYVKQGVDKAQKGKLDEAIADFNQALELDPQNADAYYNRGVAEYSNGELEAAIADYNQVIEINPEGPVANAFYNLGVTKTKK